MSVTDISKEELRKEIDGILEGADLDTLSSKKVRQQLEEKLKFDLSDRKKEIDEMVMEAVEKKPHVEDDASPKTKKEENKEDETKEPVAKKRKTAPKLDHSVEEEEENSESEGDDDDDDEDEYKPDDEDSPKKRPARQQERRQPARKGSDNAEPKTKARPVRSVPEVKKTKAAVAKSSDSEGKSAESEESEEDSDVAPAPTPKKAPTPRGRKPITKPAPVDDESEESDALPDRKLPKKRQQESGSEYEEFDEENSDSSDEGSDESYSPGKKSPGKKRGRSGGKAGGRKKRADSSDPDDSDEDWKTATKKKRGTPAKKGEGSATVKAKGGGVKAVKLSPELSDIMGTESMPRPEVVKKMWSIIKERNLYDPKNKQFAVCDEQLQKVFGVKRFRTFGMMKYLKAHFLD